MSLNLAIWWNIELLKHWTFGGCIWHGSCIGMLCLLFFAMVAMNLKDHDFGLKFSFRYQRFELWYDDPNCLRIIRISSGVSKRNKRGGSIMMQIYVNFEGFALISALFGLIVTSDHVMPGFLLNPNSTLLRFKLQARRRILRGIGGSETEIIWPWGGFQDKRTDPFGLKQKRKTRSCFGKFHFNMKQQHDDSYCWWKKSCTNWHV